MEGVESRLFSCADGGKRSGINWRCCNDSSRARASVLELEKFLNRKHYGDWSYGSAGKYQENESWEKN
ncbi:MAG: hypothetical protein J7K38_05800 [Thermoplasmata archaeon]|nr:hypothetical protein [Thermoplasmata archaeon]